MEIERDFGPEHTNFTVSGWELIALYERLIPTYRKQLAKCETLDSLNNLKRTIDEMEAGLLREKQKMLERGIPRPLRWRLRWRLGA